jgi:hypothetical protein
MPRLRAISPVRIDSGVHFRGVSGVTVDVSYGTIDVLATLLAVLVAIE